MHPDVVLIMVATAAGFAAIPTIAWFRAQRRIRDLEMALMAQATAEEQLTEVQRQLERITAQADQLLDQQGLLAARLGDRRELPPPASPRPEPPRVVTPH